MRLRPRLPWRFLPKPLSDAGLLSIVTLAIPRSFPRLFPGSPSDLPSNLVHSTMTLLALGLPDWAADLCRSSAVAFLGI